MWKHGVDASRNNLLLEKFIIYNTLAFFIFDTVLLFSKGVLTGFILGHHIFGSILILSTLLAGETSSILVYGFF